MGSHRVLRCAHFNRAGDAVATAARRSPEQLDEVREKLLLHLREVAAGSDAGPAEAERPPPRRWRRIRGRGSCALDVAPRWSPAASASPPPERRAARARAEALDRPRFSVTLTSEEVEEDIYAVTGARPRRRPRRRPRPLQKQLDLLFPGAWLSEITVESYRVPEDR